MSNMKYFNAKAHFNEKLKEAQMRDKKSMTECAFCGKHIVRNTWNKKYCLINICQQPKKRFFCSHQCKLRWIFKIEK